MRYIGSKEKIKDFIIETIEEVCGDLSNRTVADLFTGTTIIAQELKKKGAMVTTNDYMAFSFVFQNAFIKNNCYPKFEGLKGPLDNNSFEDILIYLNELDGVKGFIYRNYTKEGSANSDYKRNYFSEKNATKIDAIRVLIKKWLESNYITYDEYYLLLAALIEAVFRISNISGTYGAFLKSDDPRKCNDIMLTETTIIESTNAHSCYNEDIYDIITEIKGDILYLDPPYNNRQYPAYYHMLETIVLYDNPQIYGLTGRRPYEDMKSPFCVKKLASEAIEFVVKNAKFNHIFLSYSTDGIVNSKLLFEILSNYGEVTMFGKNHRRYKSNSFINKYDQLKELLYYVRKKEKTI
jgi:adenine-specific DNA-methyltransferase